MIDRGAIGRELPVIDAPIDRWRLRFFAKAIGQMDPVYTQLDAARAARFPDLPVPPTFLFCLELDQPDPFAYLADLGGDLRAALHAEQSFTYHRAVFAGARVTLRPRIADIYAKKARALQFVVKETEVRDQHGEPVADLRSVVVFRERGAA